MRLTSYNMVLWASVVEISTDVFACCRRSFQWIFQHVVHSCHSYRVRLAAESHQDRHFRFVLSYLITYITSPHGAQCRLALVVGCLPCTLYTLAAQCCHHLASHLFTPIGGGKLTAGIIRFIFRLMWTYAFPVFSAMYQYHCETSKCRHVYSCQEDCRFMHF